MDWIDRLAELWDRRKVLCVCAGVVLLGGWIVAHRWLPDGFGPEVYETISEIPVLGPVHWNARLRWIAREKEQYLGPIPDNADEGELYAPNSECHTNFSAGHASLVFRTFGSHELSVEAGNSPILAISTLRSDRLATGSEDGSIIVWQAREVKGTGKMFGRLVMFHQGSPATAIAISGDGTKIASGGSDGVIRIWDVKKSSDPPEKFQDQRATVYALVFSPDESKLASGGQDGILRVSDLRDRNLAREARYRTGPIYSVRLDEQSFGFRLDGPTIDTGYYGIGMLGITTGDRLPVYSANPFSDWKGERDSNPPACALSPDRKLIAVISNEHLSVWEVDHHDSFPFGLRFRKPQPGSESRIEWAKSSRELCVHVKKDESCNWIDAKTGAQHSKDYQPVSPSSYSGDSTPLPERWEKATLQSHLGEYFDILLGRHFFWRADSRQSDPYIYLSYRSRRTPLVLTELLLLPLLFTTFAFLLRRSPYWTRKHALSPATAQLHTFLTTAGAETTDSGLGQLQINSLDGPLKACLPIRAVIAIGPADEAHVEILIAGMKGRQSERAAGLLFYQEPPTALALLRMAEARMKQMAVIPIPLGAVDRVKDSPGEAAALLAEYAERYLPGRNLFDDRNAISDAVAFFGRGRLLARVEQELGNFQSLGLWGLRKAGKTSILLQLEQTLRDRAVVRIGLEHLTTQAPFGNRIFNEILHHLDRGSNAAPYPIDAPARHSAPEFISRMQELAANLPQRGPIVVMLDEMERVLPVDTASAEEFNVTFGALRNLCQDRRVMSLLVTDLFADAGQINQWPFLGAGTNPLFNFFKSVYVGPFDEADSVQMINSLGKLMNFNLQPPELESLQDLSGGHPFLARQIAAMLYERREDGTGTGRLLSNPIRYSETLRAYFPENIWKPLELRSDEAALLILATLSERDDWMADSELRERCRQPELRFWSAIEWLAQTGLIARRTEEGGREVYRIRIRMFVQWFQQSETTVRRYA